MRYTHLAAALFAAAVLAASANAQLPFPLPGQPPDDFTKRAQCTKDYVTLLDRQITVIEKLRDTGPEAIGHVCSLIEWGSNWLGGELPEPARKQLRDALGVDVDLRMIKAQCRMSQGNLDRELMTRLGFLKAERLRCDETI